MTRKTDAQFRLQNRQDTESLRLMIQSEINGLLDGKTDSEVFYKTMLESLTVFQDRHMELWLQELDRVFHFSQ